MKKLKLILICTLGIFVASCAKEDPKPEKENNSLDSESSEVRASKYSDEVILPLSLSIEELSYELKKFTDTYETTVGTYVSVIPDLEKNIAVMKLEYFDGGFDPKPIDTETAACGVDGSDHKGRLECYYWALNLMEESNCKLVSWGYTDEHGLCWEVQLDCP